MGCFDWHLAERGMGSMGVVEADVAVSSFQEKSYISPKQFVVASCTNLSVV
jgi:hypothetical protein